MYCRPRLGIVKHPGIFQIFLIVGLFECICVVTEEIRRWERDPRRQDKWVRCYCVLKSTMRFQTTPHVRIKLFCTKILCIDVLVCSLMECNHLVLLFDSLITWAQCKLSSNFIKSRFPRQRKMICLNGKLFQKFSKI